MYSNNVERGEVEVIAIARVCSEHQFGTDEHEDYDDLRRCEDSCCEQGNGYERQEGNSRNDGVADGIMVGIVELGYLQRPIEVIRITSQAVPCTLIYPAMAPST